MPDPEVLAKIYSSGYEDEWGESRGIKQVIDNLFKRIPRKPPGRLLDVGCGSGAYLGHAERSGWDVTGVDPWASSNDKRSIHPAVLPTEIGKAGFEPESFDVVTMWWVIEHYSDPFGELRKVREVIKPDGLLVVSTGNVESWEAKISGRYWHGLLFPEHCCLFTPDVLRRALRESGFEPIGIQQIPFTGGMVGNLHSYFKEKGINLGLGNPFIAALGIPIELLASLFRKSGIFTIFAKPIAE